MRQERHDLLAAMHAFPTPWTRAGRKGGNGEASSSTLRASPSISLLPQLGDEPLQFP
jgi:hypothetical protein